MKIEFILLLFLLVCPILFTACADGSPMMPESSSVGDVADTTAPVTCNHRFLPATCTAPATCSECGHTTGEALGHSMMPATCTAPATCSVCHMTEGKKAEHDPIGATCTAYPVCSVCGARCGNPMGHQYQNGACIRCSKQDPMGVKQDGITRVVCIGDSITAGGYWQSIGDHLGEGYEVLGYGVSGSTGLAAGLDADTVPKAYIDQPEHATAKRRNADVLVVMLGTNDSKGVNAGKIRADDGAQYRQDMIDLIEEYRAFNPNMKVIIAFPPTSFRPETANGISNDNIETLIIPNLQMVAQTVGADVVDTHTATENASEHFQDGVHPSDDAGRDLLASTVAEAVLKACNESDS